MERILNFVSLMVAGYRRRHRSPTIIIHWLSIHPLSGSAYGYPTIPKVLLVRSLGQCLRLQAPRQVPGVMYNVFFSYVVVLVREKLVKGTLETLASVVRFLLSVLSLSF